MAIADTISSMYENVGEVYDTITNVDVNNGKNLFDKSKAILNKGVATANGGLYPSDINFSTDYIEVKTNGTYYTTSGVSSVANRVYGAQYDSNKQYVGAISTNVGEKTFYISNVNVKYIRLTGLLEEIDTYQLELGSSATEYQPYTDNPTYKNIENIPSTIRKSYLDIMNNGIDTIYDNWEKVNGTGTSISLNNTEEAPMTIGYKGNTSQETTTGKNLLNLTNLTPSTKNGITLTKNNDGTITLNGTATGDANFGFPIDSIVANDTYKVQLYKKSGNFTGNYVSIYMSVDSAFSSFDLLSLTSTDMISMSLGDKTYTYAQIKVNSGVICNNLVVGCQVVSDASVTEFQKYTGGIASPSPSYPQDIHVVSGDNEINVVGKNLIPFSNIISTGGTTSNGITFTLQADGTIKANGTATAGISIYLTTNYIEQKAGTYTLSDGIASGQSSTTFFLYADVRHLDETPWDIKYFSTFETTTRTRTIEEAFKFKLRIVVRQGQTLNNVVFKPMLENGSTATTYEPYQGNTYPVNLPVENLFDINTNSLENRSSTRVGTTGYISLKAGTYTLSYLGADKSYYIYYDNNNTKIGESNWVNGTSTFTLANDYKLVFVFGKTGDTNINASDMSNVQIEKGTKANSYTPYGTTPIELCKIGDYQDSIKKSTGKNLFDNSLLNKEIAYQATTSISNGVLTITSISSTGVSFARLLPTLTLLPNTQYTCSFDINGAFLQARIYDVDANNYTTIATSTSGSRVSGTFTTSSNTTYELVLYITLQQSCSFSKIQVEQGSIATEYEPYGKDWYLNKQTGKVVLDGSENWAKGASRPFYTLLINDILRLQSASNNATLFCNYLSPSTPATIWGNNINGITNLDDGNAIRIRIQDNPYTITTFKEWLNDVKPVVYYALATPTYTEITDSTLLSQLEALNGARSYTTQTNISQENNDKPFILDVTALKQLTQ